MNTNLNTFTPTANRNSTRSTVVQSIPQKSKLIVVGAGAFGGWTALYLTRRGFQVTLVDAWGPGHTRSSSGDETRVIRSSYGANEFYFDLNVRALQLWKEHQQLWGQQLFFNSGVLWFCHQDKNPIIDDSLPYAKKHHCEYQYLSPSELEKKFNGVYHTQDLHHAWLDPFGGYLKARESCQLVQKAFVKEGGKYINAFVKTPDFSTGITQGVELSNGEYLQGDIYVFACGSWLGHVFSELQDVITCTKQEVYYFGLPANYSAVFDQLPAWIDLDGDDFYYGISNNAHRGFKIGIDKRGEKFNPTVDNHYITPEIFERARKFIGHRFPLLKNAPLNESRVCHYENSSDGNFIFGQHPKSINTWVLGGGSGHGFKHGPALGEMVANLFKNGGDISPLITLK